LKDLVIDGEVQLITIKMVNRFKNADKAFDYYKQSILHFGTDFDDTKALFNVGFTIVHPMDNHITCKQRDWKWEYANAEWQWYLSGDRNIKKLGELYGKIPEIWKRMADKDGNVNSNYGWQWQRNKQLAKVIDMLRINPNTRQAAISIYDAKEISAYKHDTPCTYAVQFTIINDKLNMCVTMRSNDLWYGFCNDQYCFSRLQLMVADELRLRLGEYYHFAHNLHLYNNIIEKL
jgi:thymidylate synthase